MFDILFDFYNFQNIWSNHGAIGKIQGTGAGAGWAANHRANGDLVCESSTGRTACHDSSDANASTDGGR